MHLAHSANRTVATTLDEMTVEIYDTVDRMVMRVGELLERGFQMYPDDWKRWVDEDLPFGLDTARRLRAVYLAYKHLPPEKLAQLPRAWQALFHDRNLDPTPPPSKPGRSARARRYAKRSPSHRGDRNDSQTPTSPPAG